MIETIRFLEITAEKQTKNCIFWTEHRLELIPLKMIENSGPNKDKLFYWVNNGL
jgi:hypothetical protein